MTLFPIIWLVLTIIAIVALVVLQPSRHVVWLVITLLLIAIATWVALPNNPGLRYDLTGDGKADIDKPIEIVQGLDLAGGVRVLLQADLPESTQLPNGAMEQVRGIVEQRINSLGALEPVVQLRGERRIIVELPGFENPDEAVNLIEQTALLEFVDFGDNPPPAVGSKVKTDYQTANAQNGAAPEATSEATSQATSEATAEATTEATAEATAAATAEGTTQPTAEATAEGTTVPGEADAGGPVYHTAMTGEIIQTADVAFDKLHKPMISFTLTPEGQSQFGQYTTDHNGQILGIVLDGTLISAPRINEPITGGQGVIEGSFTLDEATQLATQLRYGALPVPLRVESTSTIGPTLGQIAVQQSIRAGIIGIIVVLIFVLVYYRVPGIAATLALLAFTVLNLALYKLVPITMTLPAITGFLISIGAAVDGNILIFERMKEELRKGKRIMPAVEAGFDRAWTSIRDSHFATLIICAVLYAFGTSFGAGTVRGFALTLALGLLINLFTAITITRTFLHFILMLVSDEAVARRPWLMGVTTAKAEGA